MLPSGHLLHVVLDRITRGLSAVRADRVSELVKLGTLTRQAADFLDACVVAGLNIVVAGGTQAGRFRNLALGAPTLPSQER